MKCKGCGVNIGRGRDVRCPSCKRKNTLRRKHKRRREHRKKMMKK